VVPSVGVAVGWCRTRVEANRLLTRCSLAVLFGLVLVGSVFAASASAIGVTETYVYDAADDAAIIRMEASTRVNADKRHAGYEFARSLTQSASLRHPDLCVAPSGVAGLTDDVAGVAFRSDTSHIFRDSAGHLLEDTATNRSLIQSAIEPGSLRSTITLPDGSSLAKYFRTLPDGTQVWAEVRNGVEITNGGLNAVPR
jgi:hypothetical protein